MNLTLNRLVALVMSISLALSSLASVNARVAPSLPAPAFETTGSKPAVLAQRTPLSSGELVKYRQLADQSQSLATTHAAGASGTTKTVLIVVGVVVVLVGVAALVAANQPVMSGNPFAGMTF